MTGNKDKWHELAQKELRARPIEDLTWKTLEGIEVQPLYTQDDVADLPHLGSLPGLAPHKSMVLGFSM